MVRRFLRVRITLSALVLLALYPSLAVAQQTQEEIDRYIAAPSELSIKRDTIRNFDRELNDRWDQLDMFSKFLSYAKRATPLYSWITLCTAVDIDEWHIPLGSCLEEENSTLFRTPESQFRNRYDNVLNRLWDRNPLDSLTFSSTTQGMSTNDITVTNSLPFLHIGVFIWLVVWAVRLARSATQHARGRFSPTLQTMRLKTKGVFWICVSLWIVFTLILKILGAGPNYDRTILDLQSIVLLLFGFPSMVLGLFLLGASVWSAISGTRLVSKEAFARPGFPKKRWDALVKYDEEISAAADELGEFGEKWTQKLGEEFFALNEDRSYLPRIVDRLRKEARRYSDATDNRHSREGDLS